MISDLLLHDSTRQTIAQLLNKQTHAVLFVGQPGAGKETLVRFIVAEILGTSENRLVNESKYLEVMPSGKSVTIEQVREIQHFLTLKTSGKSEIRRVVAIFSADTLATDAQNALLKTLEEPPADTVIILVATQTEDLLPTIRSRVQLVSIASPSKEAAVKYFVPKGHNKVDVERAYSVSGGQVGLINALLNDESNELSNMVDQAKLLLSKSVFERLASVEEYSKQKESIGGLLTALKRICTAALDQSSNRGQSAAVKAWHARLAIVLDAESAYRKNANPKLLLTDLFMNL